MYITMQVMLKTTDKCYEPGLEKSFKEREIRQSTISEFNPLRILPVLLCEH